MISALKWHAALGFISSPHASLLPSVVRCAPPPWSSSSDSSLHHHHYHYHYPYLSSTTCIGKCDLIFFVMYKNASSSILRAASSRSFRSSSLTPSSSSAASPCSLLGQRSFATSSPAFRSLPRWSHCLHSRPSPFGLTSQIRTASPVLDRLQRNFSSMGNISLSLSGSTFLDLCLFIYYYFISASEHPFKGIFTTLPKPGGGEFGKFYSLPALNDPRIGNIKSLSTNHLIVL